MIIQCQNCKTKYKLEDQKIKVTGSRVKCTKCSNVFVVFKPVEMLGKEDLPENSSLTVEEKGEISTDEQDISESPQYEEEKTYETVLTSVKKDEETDVNEPPDAVIPEKEEFTLKKVEKEEQKFSFVLADEEKVRDPYSFDEKKEIKKEGFQLTKEDKEKFSSFSASFFIFIALVVFLGLASGYLTLYLISNYSFNFTLSNFKLSYSEKETSIKNIKIVNLKTNYLLNVKNEKLLVVRGDFKNISTSSFSSIEYKVTVLGQKGEILQEREMKYILPPETLDIVNSSWQEVNLKIQRKEEKGFLSSSKVLEENSIKPFIIVFKDIDPSAKEVKVEITGGG